MALSEAYMEIIAAIDMPWAESTAIDTRSYVPLRLDSTSAE